MKLNTKGNLMKTPNGNETDLHAHDHTLKCGEVVHRVYAFLDGQMNLDDVLVFKDHLKVCLPCQAYVQFEEKLINMIKSKSCNDETKIPAALMDKIKKAIEVSNLPPKS
ncbi:hypothetical protein F9K33_08510 [bacterium]|nr:MAG: hypothetical protein F9K33_08510 [bacterium]